ncbi:MAG: hypothetical protein ACOYN5_07995 [Bacteroidales bacterium]
MINPTEILDSGKAACVSIGAAITGQFTQEVSNIMFIPSLQAVNTAFQHAAWVVAIIAGLVSIINGTKNWYRTKKRRHHEK